MQILEEKERVCVCVCLFVIEKYPFTRIFYPCIDLQFEITRGSNRTNSNRMEPLLLGRGHLVNEESDLIERYSPLSSTINEDLEQDDDLFYTEEEHVAVEEKGGASGNIATEEDNESTSTLPTNSTTRSSSSIDEISGLGFGKTIDRFRPFSLNFSSIKALLNHPHSR